MMISNNSSINGNSAVFIITITIITVIITQMCIKISYCRMHEHSSIPCEQQPALSLCLADANAATFADKLLSPSVAWLTSSALLFCLPHSLSRTWNNHMYPHATETTATLSFASKFFHLDFRVCVNTSHFFRNLFLFCIVVVLIAQMLFTFSVDNAPTVTEIST